MSYFWKDMARQTPKDKAPVAPGADTEKPLPDPSTQRPGTSGTEAVLVSNRRQASETYVAAQKAERSYKTKKRSALAQANYSEAKDHFKQAAHHFRTSLALSFGVFKSTPYLVNQKLERQRDKAAEKRRLQAIERRRRLEAQLAKENAARGSSDGPNPDEDAEEEEA